ncbi:MAG: hypothetical protein EB165_07415, partial [Euryarchaeota archaeon]|nr:hypothetical protein [Euryarchaeota archaeon]NDB94448.1 hypothetical protein [Euryarchaeota archaeon]
MDARELKALVAENPYGGTAKEVSTLCRGIYQASVELDAKTMRSVRDEIPITDKIFSKLKVIGKTLSALPPDQLQIVVKALPDSYTTIQVLCGLKPQELFTAAKSKSISRTTTIRSARDYVNRVRHPSLAGDPTKPTRTQGHTESRAGDPTWKTILTLHEDPERPLTEEDRQNLLEALRGVLQVYGVEARTPETSETASSLKIKERALRETFWRQVLEQELPQRWFDETPQEVRKQFNLKTLQEVHRTPLRQFTGFLVRSSGGRKFLWETYGKAYIAKIHLEHEKTDDRTQRY